MAKHEQLQVKNWKQFQHYKDRNPPWIKLHFALLASEDWVTLDDASKLLAIVCMLIASRNDGMVPNNPTYLKRVAYLNKLPNLTPLIECGFLEIPQADASEMQADASAAQATARPETETEAEKKDSLSETSSDETPKKPSRKSYTEAFEAFWTAYPRNLNMSKSEAFKDWQKLDDTERAACVAAVPGYIAYLKTQPDLKTVHACRFIRQRRFESYIEAATGPTAADEGTWLKRLSYSRAHKKWSAAKWGPAPGADGCLVPTHLINPDDGAGWREMEAA